MTFDPKFVEVTCVTLPKDHCVQDPWKYIKVCGYSDPFFKYLNQRSLTPRWPLTPHLLRSHVWLYPWIIVSKSYGNTSIYVDTVVNFPNYHIHNTYILRTTNRMSDHIVSFWTKFRQDKKWGFPCCIHNPTLVEIHQSMWKVEPNVNLFSQQTTTTTEDSFTVVCERETLLQCRGAENYLCQHLQPWLQRISV